MLASAAFFAFLSDHEGKEGRGEAARSPHPTPTACPASKETRSERSLPVAKAEPPTGPGVVLPESFRVRKAKQATDTEQYITIK